MTIVAFVQEHVVNRTQWLTSREFLDGLALGQMTPGPTLMIAAYVGYKLAGLSGAIVSALCIFAPAFFLVLPLMSVLDKVKQLRWVNAAMRGISPAVIACLVVTLAQLLPHASPDAFAGTILLLAALAIALWKVSPLPLIVGAGLLRAVGARLPL
jgi:chromate transporter